MLKRNISIWIALVLSVSILAGCDLTSFLELGKPQPAKPELRMTLRAEPLTTGDSISASQLQATWGIIEKRAKAMGISQVLLITYGQEASVVLPGVNDTQQVVKAIIERGFIELLDGGDTPPQEGDLVFTTLGGPPAGEPQPTDATVWPVVLTSDDLVADKVAVQFDSANQPQVSFTFNENGAKKFADFTTNHIGKYMPIALDKKIISAPVIQGAITGGSGVINSISRNAAEVLVVQQKFGALPVHLRLLESTVTQP